MADALLGGEAGSLDEHGAILCRGGQGGQSWHGLDDFMCNGQNLKQLSHAGRSALREASEGSVDVGSLVRRGAGLQSLGPSLDSERLKEIALRDDAVSPSVLRCGSLVEAVEVHMGGEIRLARFVQRIDRPVALQRLQGVAEGRTPVAVIEDQGGPAIAG